MSNVVLPTNEVDRKKIMDGMREISDAYTRMDAEKEFVKEAIDALAQTYNLPKPILKKLSVTMHKGSIDKEAGMFEDFISLYETLTSSTKKETE